MTQNVGPEHAGARTTRGAEESVQQGAQWIERESQAGELASLVTDPARTQPLVCVTTQSFLERPMMDADALAATLGERASVWVVNRPSHGWSLTNALPAKLDVHGGAVRIWMPIADDTSINPDDHPSFAVYTPEDGERCAAKVEAFIDRSRALDPLEDGEAYGVVTAVLASGAELTLASGHLAFVANAHLLAEGQVFHAREAVNVGDQVRVMVTERAPQAGRDRVRVSMKPFAPNPWVRLADQHAVGSIVEGVVVERKKAGAMVELLPGASAWLYVGNISKEFVSHTEDVFDVDERVVVKLIKLDVESRTAEVSLSDVPEDAYAEPVASLYPGGPPWLAAFDEPYGELESADRAEDEDATAAFGPDAHDQVPHADQRVAEGVSVESEAPGPEAPISADTAVAPSLGEVEDFERPLDETLSPDTPLAISGDGSQRPHSVDDAATISALEAAIDAGIEQQEELATAHRDAQRRIERLRGDAQRMTSSLETQIRDAEHRILRLTAESASALVQQTEQETSDLRTRVQNLELQLRAAEAERTELIGEVSAQRERANGAVRSRDDARRRAERSQQAAAVLRAQLSHADGGDPERGFVRELHFTWEQLNTTPEDRASYAMVQVQLGPEFLESLARIEGVSRERILQVCAHVAGGRAPSIAGLAPHQLRSGAGGEDAPVVRDDGATAWRVNLQVNTPSARRLHYWQLPGGRIEFSKVGVHDDMSIA